MCTAGPDVKYRQEDDLWQQFVVVYRWYELFHGRSLDDFEVGRSDSTVRRVISLY